MKYQLFLSLVLALLPLEIFSQIVVTVDASSQPKPISKYIYGKNNSLSDNPSSPLSAAAWTQIRDAGLNFLRESGGNNCTKYNWREKISSHPDWYNNVYAHDWDFAAQSLQQNLPSAQGMWAFQLIGKSAKTPSANFGDWAFNQSQWWQGVNQNLAGGGTPNPTTWAAVTNPSTASTTTNLPGDTSLYLEKWTADSTVAILNQWFNKLHLAQTNFQYWNMDNEIEIWSSTHDDVMPTQLSPDAFMQLYFAVAKKARTAYPNIKLVGPVTANEWQWYNWNNQPIKVNGTNYSWLEYFIKSVAAEEQASGIRLLDVLDIHFYPGSTNIDQVVQMHRVYFDTTYVFPEANGVRTINGGYDNSIKKEYIFKRCNDWLTKYMGANHNVTLGVTETGVNITDPNALAVWYASTIGEFTKHPEVEIFSPWTWNVGMWEALHLFSRYDKPWSIAATSTKDSLISAYPTINANKDSLTVIVVNRSSSSSQSVKLNFNGFDLTDDNYTVLKLSNLPSTNPPTETFVSHQNNALQKSTVNTTGNSITFTMPALSVAAFLISGKIGTVTEINESNETVLQVFPNPTDSKTNLIVNGSGQATIDLIDSNGKIIKEIYQGGILNQLKQTVDLDSMAKGVYFVRLSLNGKRIVKKIIAK